MSRDSRWERSRERFASRLDALELADIRRSRESDDDVPLVTVRIATFAAAEGIRASIESALKQDYPRVEVLVIGDYCDPKTAEVVRSYEDRGVTFINLGRRGQYPIGARQRWMVAGATPMNIGALMAAGSWIAPMDDDDQFSPDHVSRLMDWAQEHGAEMVWSDAAMENADGSWSPTPGPPLALGRISHGSVIFRSDISFIDLNRRSYLIDEPADWNLWRRMRNAGVKISYCPGVTYFHYL